jgi:hypothetical protein
MPHPQMREFDGDGKSRNLVNNKESKQDAVNAVCAILQGDPTSYELHDFRDVMPRPGVSRKTRTAHYDIYLLVCYKNTLTHTGWAVCPYFRDGSCSVETVTRKCGAIPSDFNLITPAPQITPPTTYPNTAPAADQTFDVYCPKLLKIMIAPDAPSDDYRHPPCSLTAVRRLIATYRTMAHSLSYHDDFGSSPFLTGARHHYVRTVAPPLHCQTHPNFNVR